MGFFAFEEMEKMAQNKSISLRGAAFLVAVERLAAAMAMRGTLHNGLKKMP